LATFQAGQLLGFAVKLLDLSFPRKSGHQEEQVDILSVYPKIILSKI
jgi:hypothetical protein